MVDLRGLERMPRSLRATQTKQSECGMRAFVVRLLSVMAILSLMISTAQAKPAPDSFAELAEQLLPSVVNISTTQVLEGQPGIEAPTVPPGSPFEDFFKEFFERNQPQMRQRRATSLGSGFILDTEGHVVTNNHVIQDADEISVVLPDETRAEAKVIGRDPKTDLAVLKIDPPHKLSPVKFGDSDLTRVGDWVIAIGNPFGFGGTVTAGIISARGRDINAGPYDDFLQTDASINRGNSGGPMFNLEGGLIGINTAIFSPSGGSVGIGFAIPSNVAQPVIEQLIKYGSVKRGWLGVRIQSVTEEIAETLGLPKAEGALVASVIDGGPAEQADIQAGDVILEFNGQPVDEMRQLPRLVAETEVDRTVKVEVWRDGKKVTLDVKVGALEEGEEAIAEAAPHGKSPGSAKHEIQALGLTVATLDEALRREFGIQEDTRGVVVIKADPRGPAAEQGLKAGDVIVEVSKNPVNSPADIEKEVSSALGGDKQSVLLLVESEGGLRFVALRLDKD